MRLRRVKLTNFRCFERLEVSLSPDLTVLVGNNAAGKTALLDGIAYALSRVLTCLLGIEGKNLRHEDIKRVQQNARNASKIAQHETEAPFVQVEAETTDGIRWSRTLKRDLSEQTAADVPDSVGDKPLFESLDRIIHAINEGGDPQLPVFAYYGVSRAVLDIPERRRNFQKEFRRFDALKGALDPTTKFKDLFEWFYAQERDEMERITQALSAPEFDLWLNTRNAPGRPPLPGPLPVLQAVRDAIVSVIPGFSRPRIRTNPLRMVVSQGVSSDKEIELSLQMLGDGYRTMLALVMDFARRMAQANPQLIKPLEAEAILIVDEIDLHLHPIWQQTVVPSFRRAFPNTQLIFSTHSPQVLTTIHSDNIMIIDSSGVCPCPAPTYGARSSDVVEDVLGLPSLRPPGNEIAGKIRSLFEALDEQRLEDAKTLREQLQTWAKGYPEPDLVRADALIRRLKRVRKSLPEPQELADFRQRFAAAPRSPTWREFAADPRRREPIRRRLREDQRGLCAYCESSISPGNECVEHFVAKSIDHARELDWSDLLVCCLGGEKYASEEIENRAGSSHYEPARTCGHSKMGSPNSILNPRAIPLHPRLFYFALGTGEIRADLDCCRSAGIEASLAEQTILTLNLRAKRLNRARLALLDELLDQCGTNFSGERAPANRCRADFLIRQPTRLFYDHSVVPRRGRGSPSSGHRIRRLESLARLRRPAVDAPGGAGFGDDDFRQQREAGF